MIGLTSRIVLDAGDDFAGPILLVVSAANLHGMRVSDPALRAIVSNLNPDARAASAPNGLFQGLIQMHFGLSTKVGDLDEFHSHSHYGCMDRDFSKLSPRDFEKLALDLVGREIKLRFEAFTDGADGGIDGRHVGPGTLIILQAKHYFRSDFRKLASTMKKERVKIDELQPTRYILATSVALTPANKSRLEALIGPWLKCPGDILGKDDLNHLLALHPKVELAYEGLWQESAGILQKLVRDAVHDAFPAPKVLPFPQRMALSEIAVAPSSDANAWSLDDKSLPINLIWAAVNEGSAVNKDHIDAFLQGSNTVSAKKERDRVLRSRAQEAHACSKSRASASSHLQSVSSELRTVESMTPPSAPYPPNMSQLPSEEYMRRVDQLARERSAYEERSEAYKTQQLRLPSLREAKRQAEADLRQSDAALARQEAETSADDARLRKAVDEARDRDFSIEIHRHADAARQAFDKGEPVKGLSRLLICATLYNVFEPSFFSPEAARAVAGRIREFAELPEWPDAAFTGSIAKASLAGPLKLAAVLGENRASARELMDVLATLPLEDLHSDVVQARELLEVQPLTIPALAKLERVSEIASTRELLIAALETAGRQISAIQVQVNLETDDRREEVRRANERASQVVDEIARFARSHDDLRQKTILLWGLIVQATSNINLPTSWRGLCSDLTAEVSRRLGVPVASLLAEVDQTDFGLDEVRSSLAVHVLTSYCATRDALSQEFRKWEEHRASLGEALEELKKQPKRVSDKYHDRLRAAGFLSIIPVVSLICALWNWKLTSAVIELLVDGGIVYRGLADVAAKALSVTLVIQFIVVCIALSTSYYFMEDASLDQTVFPWVACGAVVCLLGFTQSIRNYLALKAAMSRLQRSDLSAAN